MQELDDAKSAIVATKMPNVRAWAVPFYFAERSSGGTERMSTNTPENLQEVASHALFGIRQSVDKLSRKADAEWGHCQFASKRIVEYGPLTTDIARDTGLPISVTRYHLTKLWRAGEIQKHLSYRGCIARWYSLPNVKHIRR
jgi:hypothetical protein